MSNIYISVFFSWTVKGKNRNKLRSVEFLGQLSAGLFQIGQPPISQWRLKTVTIIPRRAAVDRWTGQIFWNQLITGVLGVNNQKFGRKQSKMGTNLFLVVFILMNMIKINAAGEILKSKTYSGLSNNRVYTEHGNLVHFPLCTILFDSVLAILLYKVRCARSMSAPKIPLCTFIWWCTIIW